MPEVPSIAWLNGGLVAWRDARIPVEDRGLQFGESLYEVLPVTGGRARMLEAHVRRMRGAATVLGIDRGVPEIDAWRSFSEQLVRAEGLEEGLLYAQVTGGTSHRSHVPLDRPATCFFAYLQTHRFPRASDVRPARVLTLPDSRWARCDLKTTMLLPAVLARREAARKGADEAILLGPGGEVREGATSNLFLVRGTRLCSPPMGPHVLPGITRLLVSELAAEAGLAMTEGTVPLPALFEADEVFLTSTSKLVTGVAEVDGRPVGGGSTGPVTTDLGRRVRLRLGLDDGITS